MRILAVDDEYLSLEALKSAIRKAMPQAELHGFQSAAEAVDYARTADVDAAFLDVRMRDSNGISLAETLGEMQPGVNIIFTTGYSEYMKDAFRLHASGYILKPVTAEKVANELADLRRPVTAGGEIRVSFRTFGTFEVFANGQPMVFSYTKTKELLACLVDGNGALCSLASVVDTLWEDGQGMDVHGSYLRNMLSDLQRVLRENECEDILLRSRGYAGIDRSRVRCDLFDFMDGKESAIRAFSGAYMSQYSWAESTLAELVSRCGQ